MDDAGFNVPELYVHYLTPIYPDDNLSVTEDVNRMMKANYELWTEKYEEFYKEKVKY